MRLKMIAEILECEVEDADVAGFAIDSRKVSKGNLFFALKGEKYNGHGFLKEVAAKGAVGAVVERSYEGPTGGLLLIRVDDVVGALQKLAKTVQAKRKMKVVAVTGSVGKTMTKEFIATLLEKKYRVAKTPGNANSQVGLPIALLNGVGDEEILVVEMGMSHPGEIKKLVEIVPPDAAIVTKIGHAHIEFFADGQDGIAKEKAEIFSHPKTKVCIASAQAMGFDAVKKRAQISFGVGSVKADYVLKEGLVVEEYGKTTPPFALPFEESHFCEDFIAAAAVAREMGLEWKEIFEQVKKLKGATLRFEKIERNGVVFVNDCYNANPESMKAALDNLPKPRMGGKTMAIFGEMTELGKHGKKKHQELAEHALKKIDHMLCYGKGCLPMLDVFAGEKRPAEFFVDLGKLKKALFEIAKPGDVVLIKGSNANKLWQLLE